jgi:perosamine synthetase
MPLGPWITQDDKAAVMRVLDSGDLMSGKQVAAFEEELAAYFGKRHAVCVSSGTAALECAFVATGEGGKIHPDGFVAILSAARAAGRDPKPGDSYGGVPTSVLGQALRDTKALVADCSHTFSPKYLGGAVACYSMNANKFIACGGGAAITDDPHFAAVMRQYRNHGRDGGPEIRGPGRNLRMGEMNAALGRSQLKRIDQIIERRAKVAAHYDSITGLGIARGVKLDWFLYPWPDQPRLAKKHRSMADFRLFGTASDSAYSIALLPIWPLMTKKDCKKVCS